MAELALPPGVRPPDFYIAAIGRSGSTMLANWLSRPPSSLVFSEPFFARPENPRLLRLQLAAFGLPVPDGEWEQRDESGAERFARIMGPRLAGKRWAFKEVLCEEHGRAIEAFAPARVVVTVRNIRDVALSFFEKHRLQGNLDRFDDRWVADYCIRESAGMLRFIEQIEAAGLRYRVVRYEDVTASREEQLAIADFVGWEGGGAIDSHLAAFGRGFEVERHGREISSRRRRPSDRALGAEEQASATKIAVQASEYQSKFGYTEGIR